MEQDISPAVQISDEDILKEINATVYKKTGFLKILIMFAISVLFFIGAGLISTKIEQLFMLIIVLLVHELGHLLSMKAFGYSNVKMFFLPFFGAATSGNEKIPNATKEALVALSGPLPGIFVGIILSVFYGISGKEIYCDFGIWFLFLNGFNLLPFYPLDGGRFFNAVLFSRNYIFELLFKTGTSIILLLLALSLKAYILLLIPFFMLTSLRTDYYSSKAAKVIRRDSSREKLPSFKLDVDSIRLIRGKLDTKTFAQKGLNKLKYVSFVIYDTWKRIYLIPPKITTTIFLIVVYSIVSFFSLIGFSALWVIQSEKSIEYELSTRKDNDNKIINIELQYVKGKWGVRTELDDSFRYHGKREVYLPDGTLKGIGYFYHGVPDGEWEDYQTHTIQKFDKGKYISKKQIKNDVWIETPWEDLSKLDKLTIENWLKSQKTHSKLRPNS